MRRLVLPGVLGHLLRRESSARLTPTAGGISFSIGEGGPAVPLLTNAASAPWVGGVGWGGRQRSSLTTRPIACRGARGGLVSKTWRSALAARFPTPNPGASCAVLPSTCALHAPRLIPCSFLPPNSIAFGKAPRRGERDNHS